jgi:hypothetical protein
VDDASWWIEMATEWYDNETVNIESGKEIQIRDLIDLISDLTLLGCKNKVGCQQARWPAQKAPRYDPRKARVCFRSRNRF